MLIVHFPDCRTQGNYLFHAKEQGQVKDVN
jgi:hypothetical protein